MRTTLVRGALLLGWLPTIELANAQSTRPRTPSVSVEDAVPVRDVVRKLYGIRWHSTLDGAVQDATHASRGRKPQRPIVWLRTLGDLAGFT